MQVCQANYTQGKPRDWQALPASRWLRLKNAVDNELFGGSATICLQLHDDDDHDYDADNDDDDDDYNADNDDDDDDDYYDDDDYDGDNDDDDDDYDGDNDDVDDDYDGDNDDDNAVILS